MQFRCNAALANVTAAEAQKAYSKQQQQKYDEND